MPGIDPDQLRTGLDAGLAEVGKIPMQGKTRAGRLVSPDAARASYPRSEILPQRGYLTAGRHSRGHPNRADGRPNGPQTLR
jgi:hypothetical protein